jgi:hypothetical protein
VTVLVAKALHLVLERIELFENVAIHGVATSQLPIMSAN